MGLWSGWALFHSFACGWTLGCPFPRDSRDGPALAGLHRGFLESPSRCSSTDPCIPHTDWQGRMGTGEPGLQCGEQLQCPVLGRPSCLAPALPSGSLLVAAEPVCPTLQLLLHSNPTDHRRAHPPWWNLTQEPLSQVCGQPHKPLPQQSTLCSCQWVLQALPQVLLTWSGHSAHPVASTHVPGADRPKWSRTCVYSAHMWACLHVCL